ncbi:SDR family NAD(P)-dependent oxidoreductase [Lysobacter sp. MMG2]|uniref:SDR family NAD(P)-dependent oxidoreductase n=1 Tax=Lysobacter sp. MMG2 TaxID=2801338 RepID=UPI001C233A37|nr:SDR family NAD(P)-dependent oxidoreductase [Lysobacter sp. MMG2]MBU8977949.1 SDR family NAD(P)-dependent oxidoreductase [Lysobacter sp. MMG2]
MTIRFDGRVAIVTGAGNGLGRAHALGLASRGAKVVINDLGGSRDGTGGSGSAAEAVVEEIRRAGGEAIANGANVTDFEQVVAMVDQTRAAFGRVDILINNAGILRDKSFSKMEMSDFRAVLDVHLMGSVNCTKAVWELMREQNYGRILMTSSSSGLFGNFGQSNYGAAKMGLVGLMHMLTLEGRKNDIRVNTIAPMAATRMTEDVLPPAMLDAIKPEKVTPAALFLVSENAPSKLILSAGGGAFSAARVVDTEPLFVLAARDPHLAAAQAVLRPQRRLALVIRARDDVGQRGARLGFGQAHRAEEATLHLRPHERLDLCRGAVGPEQVRVADGEERVGRGGHVRGQAIGEAGLLDDQRQLHAAQAVVLPRGHQPGFAERAQRLADFRNDVDRAAVQVRFVLVALLVVRGEQFGGDLLVGIQSSVEGLA